LAPGTTGQFSASGTLADETVQDLTTWATWSSSNTAFAAISNTAGSRGRATAVAEGTAIIEASYGGSTGAATLTTSGVASISVTPSSKSIPAGTSQQFSATGTLEDTTVQDLTSYATWTSSDLAVATISNDFGSRGLAIGTHTGTTLITAAFDELTSSPAALTITEADLLSISISPPSPDVPLGKTQQFIATGTFTGNTTQDITSLVTWHSSNTGIATISNTSGSRGLATTLNEGTTIISASLSGIHSSSATLTVTPPALTAIVVAPASATVFPGGSQQFSATGILTDGSSQNLTSSVTWFSSNTAIAISNTQGSKGLATASPVTGSTNITAQFSGITSNTAILNVVTF
jgi:hypothetical protein